jgi:hypothetical protein
LLRSSALVVRLTLAAATFAAGQNVVRAELTTYFGGPDDSKLTMANARAARDSFVATLASYGVEDLEDLGGQLNPTLTFGSTGVTAATGFANGVNQQPFYAVSGSHFLWDKEGDADWLLFSQPVTAFGTYVVQGGDGPANTVTVRLENTQTGASKDVVQTLGPSWPFYNVVFFGVTDTAPFNRVSLVESHDSDGLLPDDLIAGYVVPSLAGDFNKNDVVDVADLVVWQDNYGGLGASAYLNGDGDGDGDADAEDLLVWQRQLGMTLPLVTPASMPVPEPAAAILLLLAAVARRGIRFRAKA